MCRVVRTDFDPDMASVPLARHMVADLLDRWELPALRELAELLTTELLTNALVHVGGGLSVVVAVADGVLEIGVSDQQPHSGHNVRPKSEHLGDVGEGGDSAEGGRGLLLVDSLADEWGVIQLENGKQVWFRISTDDWSYRSGCMCHSDSIDRVRLESGRYALALSGPWDA